MAGDSVRIDTGVATRRQFILGAAGAAVAAGFLAGARTGIAADVGGETLDLVHCEVSMLADGQLCGLCRGINDTPYVAFFRASDVPRRFEPTHRSHLMMDESVYASALAFNGASLVVGGHSVERRSTGTWALGEAWPDVAKDFPTLPFDPNKQSHASFDDVPVAQMFSGSIDLTSEEPTSLVPTATLDGWVVGAWNESGYVYSLDDTGAGSSQIQRVDATNNVELVSTSVGEGGLAYWHSEHHLLMIAGSVTRVIDADDVWELDGPQEDGSSAVNVACSRNGKPAVASLTSSGVVFVRTLEKDSTWQQMYIGATNIWAIRDQRTHILVADNNSNLLLVPTDGRKG